MATIDDLVISTTALTDAVLVAQTALDAAVLAASDSAASAAQSAIDAVASLSERNTSAAMEAATLSAELLDGSAWVAGGSGWTLEGVGVFQHVVGQTDTLSHSLPATGTKRFHVQFTVTSPSTGAASYALTVSIGGSYGYDIYDGGGTRTYQLSMTSVSDGNLVFTPLSTFDGEISAVSVKEVTGVSTPSLTVIDSTGAVTDEQRYTLASLFNQFNGRLSGQYNVTGQGNTSMGYSALAENIDGFWNTAIGRQTLSKNINGSRNTAIGYVALNNNTYGNRNVGIGTFALTNNTTGIHNIAVGSDCLNDNTTGSDNVGIGFQALYANVDGVSNIGIGQRAAAKIVDGDYNISIGNLSMASNVSANYCTNVGASGQTNGTGGYNTSVGALSLYANASGTDNVAIGYYANKGATGAGNGNVSYNTIIGSKAGSALSTGADNNVLIGYNAGASLTSGANNIIIGSGILGTAGDANKINIGNFIYCDTTSTTPTISIGSAISTETDNVYTGTKLQIGRTGEAGIVDLKNSSSADNTVLGTLGFVNQANGDTTGATRKVAAMIQVRSVTTDANAGLDSGGVLTFTTKPEANPALERMRIDSTGRVGIGVTSPTAYLHLRAGGASAGTTAFMMTAGTLLSAPVAGAIEFDGTNLYFTDSTNTRRTLAVV